MKKNHPDHQLKEHYKELFETSVKELQMSRLHVDFLLNLIEEIDSLNKDTLIEKIIENGLERYELDKLCHAREIFY